MLILFKYGDRIGGTDVIFGEEGDSVLLGAFTLEALGLALDPLRRELKPLRMAFANISSITMNGGCLLWSELNILFWIGEEIMEYRLQVWPRILRA